MPLGYDAVNYSHSGLDEDEREKIFHSFRESGINFLITTDIMARGIDNPNVNVVINYDLPMKGESFLHRAGRGGRYGQKAICISILAEQRELQLMSDIMRQLAVEIKHIKSVADIPASEYVSDANEADTQDEDDEDEGPASLN
ncbi:hypothetical protein KIPB_007965 [Kipferlia bialata]|uniref:Helicase C-terminal domain-containing protein n=1 Tax=Kipferlia bialata TaxID=797122 RepID=A0A9K3D0V7_9EUKA|nr:hypothetical protein KIPB_007965 [Kipferlia bialata]|eukprot:g7965.t1